MILQIGDIAEVNVSGSSIADAIEIGGKRKIDHAKRTKDLGNNCLALAYLLDHVGRVDRVTDFFGGLGLWASIVRARLPDAELRLVDFDRACAQHLRNTFRGSTVLCDDSYEMLRRGNTDQLNLLDFTKCTWLTLRKADWVSGLFVKPSWVVLSDCAGSKLHFNYKHYGLRAPNYMLYLRRYVEWVYETFGFACVAAVACGGDKRPNSGYLLLHKTTQRPYTIRRLNCTGVLVEKKSPGVNRGFMDR